MLRNAIPEALKSALKLQEKRTISTVRLIMAALKDRDIAARSKGDSEGIADDEILQMLQILQISQYPHQNNDFMHLSHCRLFKCLKYIKCIKGLIHLIHFRHFRTYLFS